jgi:hypothetical protein
MTPKSAMIAVDEVIERDDSFVPTPDFAFLIAQLAEVIAPPLNRRPDLEADPDDLLSISAIFLMPQQPVAQHLFRSRADRPIV